ncbi:MAG: hypothetical protein ACLFPS_09635 [Clostridia bacterium]
MAKIIDEYYPLIKELFSQSRISFLIGAGCSCCAGLPLMKSLTKEVMAICSTVECEDEKRASKLLQEIEKRYEVTNNFSVEVSIYEC